MEKRWLSAIAALLVVSLGACGQHGSSGTRDARIGDDGGGSSDAIDDGAGEKSMADSSALPLVKICDGSSSQRFIYAAFADRGRLLEGHAILHENGSSFFMVDGTCHFWSNLRAETWSDYHAGQLSPLEADELSRAVKYGYWNLTADQTWVDPGVFDAGLNAFGDGEHWVMLRGFTSTDSLPELPAALWSWQHTSFLKSASAGLPTTGPVRYRIFKRDFDGVANPVESWPLSSEFASLVEGVADLAINEYGKGKFADGDDGAKLRSLRRSFEARHPGGFPMALDFIPIGTPDMATAPYLLFLRDTTPFEQMSDGLVPGLPRQ